MVFTSKLQLLLISTIVGVCFCSPYYTTTTVPTTTEAPVVDVGCYAARALARRYPLFYRHLHTPTCVEGGLWRHYQCRVGYPCYCVFVDTGNNFQVYPPNGAHLSLYYSYFHFPKFAEQACPVQKEVQTSDNDCRNPPLNYPCELNQLKYTFNPSTQTCEETFGCHGYVNRSDCESRCSVQVFDSCSLPLDLGDFCDKRQEVTRYRHNPTSGQCESFDYRGCGGNSNNYEDMWDCQRSCVTQSNVSVIVRVDDGLTYILILPQWVVERYELDLNETNDIDEDIFASIGEHVVDFEIIFDDSHDDSRTLTLVNVQQGKKTIQESQRESLPSSLVCSLPDETGPCRAYFPRWFYDPVRDVCAKFVFGGCRGNGNNFETADECTFYCRAANTPSPLELVADPTDSDGNVIPDPRGIQRCEKNLRGEVICRIPTDAPTTTTPYEIDEENESAEKN